MAKFDHVIENLRNTGEWLVPYNYPHAPQSSEKDISILKETEVEVDGYTVGIHFNKSKYNGYFLETLQIYNKFGPFLPFNVVVKLGCKTLGSSLLSLVEFWKEDYKIYCWSVCVDDRGRPIPSPIEEESESCEYEGFSYKYMDPSSLNFY